MIDKTDKRQENIKQKEKNMRRGIQRERRYSLLSTPALYKLLFQYLSYFMSIISIFITVVHHSQVQKV